MRQIALEKIRGNVKGLEGPHDEHFAARTLGVIKARRKFLALIGRTSTAAAAAGRQEGASTASSTDDPGDTATDDSDTAT